MSELQRLNDPNYAIQLAVGPPLPELVAQQPNTGLSVAGRYDHTAAMTILHAGLCSRRPICPMTTSGSLISAQATQWRSCITLIGERESVCTVTGYGGMPSLKIRPKSVSRHGRQNMYMAGSKQILFNIGKESKLKHLALRSNLAVRKGDGKDIAYRVLPDLMGRTLQIVTHEKEELVCFVQKTAKALIMEAALGSGSEMVMDVAPGVDWTAMVAILMAVQQVGAHLLKDALGNYVFDPLKEQAVQGVIEGVGMQDAAASAGHSMDSAMHFYRKAQELHRIFFT